MKNIYKIFIKQCEFKNIYLSIEYDPEMFCEPIYTDQKRLKQIFINLIGNAFKFTHNGGITVHLDKEYSDSEESEPQEYLRANIRDTGNGIPEHIIK